MASTPPASPDRKAVPVHLDSSGHRFLIPSPIVTRRTRTFSSSKAASEGPTKNGVIKSFCRQKGHGFIIPDHASQDNQAGSEPIPSLFVHISDIAGEYCPVEGDHVTYKECLIPPKRLKKQAVEVVITELAPGTKHHRWEDPPGTD